MSKNRGQSEHRSLSRKAKEGRDFSNKKGIQLVITRFGGRFTKIEKDLQYLKGKTLIHYKYS